MKGELLYRIYSKYFVYRHPLPWKHLIIGEKNLWAKIEETMGDHFINATLKEEHEKEHMDNVKFELEHFGPDPYQDGEG